MLPVEYIVAIVKPIVILVMVLNLVPLLIWMERKGAAYIQDRRGPNRADILGIRLGGLVHTLSDVVKLITKADVENNEVFRPMFVLAPIIALFVASITVAVVPLADPLTIGGFTLTPVIADLSAGLIYVFAFSSLGVYALLLAGWSSGGKYSFLGALRASSQMVSYEIAMGLSVVSLFLVAGSFRLYDIVAHQGAMVWDWNVARMPLAFVIFFTALFAETNRMPFDMPEGESELAAGFHTEYSSMRFALFFMGEYMHIAVGSLITVALFFGGWNIPFVSSEWLHANSQSVFRFMWAGGSVGMLLLGGHLVRHYFRRRGFWGDRRDFEPMIFGVPATLLGLALGSLYILYGAVTMPDWVGPLAVFLLQLTMMLAKALFFCATFIWIRWTLPRFRYDQLMRLGWKMMIPLAIANIVVVGAWVVWR